MRERCRFGIDEPAAPQLVGWVAKGTRLEELVARARVRGVMLGEVTSGTRRRPDGVILSWRYTDPSVVLEHRLIPYLID